jgi:hypothetical protein
MHHARHLRVPSPLAPWRSSSMFALARVQHTSFGLCDHVPLVSLSANLGFDALAPLPKNVV